MGLGRGAYKKKSINHHTIIETAFVVPFESQKCATDLYKQTKLTHPNTVPSKQSNNELK